MDMSVFLGIDGGGSNLRLAVTDAALHILAETRRGSANPSSIGWDAAKALIQGAIREVTTQAGAIEAVGIGIAGAAASHSADWLREVVGEVLPHARVVPGSDMEIALAGANGERRGVLVLAGTGSVAYGVNDAGESIQVGGWGYLIGDEGSGYAIGLEALRTITRQADETHPYQSVIYKQVMEALALSQPKDLIAWLYRGESRTREIAGLAAVVLDAAKEGDARAVEILDTAADDLRRLAETVIRRLAMPEAKIAFAGGLLSEPNPLSLRLCQRLNLSAFPVAKYPPVIGAALLAKHHQDE
jgi:glucosamine kinase